MPSAHRGLVAPQPLTAMGRYRHEAAAVDPKTGIVYLTEDRDDCLFYRFLPDAAGRTGKGGRLQALAFANGDTRRQTAATGLAWSSRRARPRPVRWIDMKMSRARMTICACAAMPGARCALPAAKGCISPVKPMARAEFYFTCTSGGRGEAGPDHALRSQPA